MQKNHSKMNILREGHNSDSESTYLGMYTCLTCTPGDSNAGEPWRAGNFFKCREVLCTIVFRGKKTFGLILHAQSRLWGTKNFTSIISAQRREGWTVSQQGNHMRKKALGNHRQLV
jgi:hypothetical protein